LNASDASFPGRADRQRAMLKQAVFNGRVLSPAPFDIILALMLRSTPEGEMARRKWTAWRQSAFKTIIRESEIAPFPLPLTAKVT